MPILVAPTERVHASFLAAMAEFRAEGRGAPDDASMVGREIREFGGGWEAPAEFAEYTRRLREQALEDAPRPPGFVPCTTLWWVDGAEYLGRLAIRRRLTPGLREAGGHIGYDVRRTARGRGHATRMLRAALPVAYGLGIDSALVTCDHDNVASRKVIEKNGGVLEDRRGVVLRFWVPTRPAAGDRPREASGRME
ncbi:GNAT family N-acetyltransferase [Actinoallomurus vinaceus]